jgi:hypothetical protein
MRKPFNSLFTALFPLMRPDQSPGSEAASGISVRPHPSSPFLVDEQDVFYQPEEGDPIWICAPLHVKALVRDAASENWGQTPRIP